MRPLRRTAARRSARLALTLAVASLLAAACGGGDAADSATDDPATSDPATADSATGGIRLVTATDGAALLADPPEDLVVLDVRTPEEFDEAHIDGAVMLDFHREDFADALADLDPDVPYLLYCRSGNRSGQTAALMEQLGFTDVADVDGGILSWTDAGLPVVVG
ncbi:MAG: rhodanese-like domain-containing protein [Actinomycetota bacterium]